MPVILAPQVPVRPTVQASLTWAGAQGAEVLSVEVTDGEGVIASYNVDFSSLGAEDEFQGIELPKGVPAWCNVVAYADRADDGVLTVTIADWSRPNAADNLTQSLPWEA